MSRAGSGAAALWILPGAVLYGRVHPSTVRPYSAGPRAGEEGPKDALSRNVPG